MTRPHLPKRLVSVLAALFLSAAGAGAATVASSTAANAAAGCTAAYSETTVWNTGFTANVNVTNSGTTAITGWTVTLTYAGNPTLQPGGWNGTWSQTGATVTVTNLSYNGALAPGASATGIGSNFNYTGTHTPASSVTCTPAGGTTANTVTVTNPGSQTTTVGTAVSRQISATDSAAGQTLTFSATGLPAGLSISSSGLISGTPTGSPGAFSVTVTARDGTGASGSATFTWTITAATGNTVTVTNPGSQTTTVGTAVSRQISATDSGAGQTLTFTATGLPAGLSISSSGLISGTPTTAGTSSVTVTARDGTGASGSATFTWTVTAAATQSIKTSATSLSVNQSSSGTVGVSLAIAPSSNVTVTTTRTSGNTGLSVSAGGTLTFTPANFATAQNVTFAADAASTGSATFTLSATGIPSVTVTVTENAVVASGAPQLHVSGNKLLDASGNTVILRGINRSGTEYSCVQGNGVFDGEVDQAAVTAMKSWKVNAVRVPLNEACWNGESYVPASGSGTTYINAIKSWVSLLNSNGLDVILDLHWTDGTYTGPGAGNCTQATQAEAFCQKPMPDAAQAIPFWTSVANTFKGNNSVLFDLFNEPFVDQAAGATAGWTCWLNGGTCSGIGFQVAGMQAMVNAVRSTGAANVLMLGGVTWSNDLTQWLAHEPTDPDHNLAVSWHSYNFNACSNQSCWTSQIQPVAAQVPVVTGEMGENDCAGGYINQLMPFLDSIGVSYLGWAWNADFNCSSGPSLITDYVPGTPTAFGAAYKAHLASLSP
jgi:endoglucanase